ncbi:MAG: hypothetical protein QNK22_08855 [Xanthomonadales bacterium]|nr:hypothetical protein [Xanthomonadales bacterium]
MDNPTTLLVAIMFVTIVVTGIVNILMFLSTLLAGKVKTHPLHSNWVILLLVAYLNFFWQTTLILEIEGWTFLSFIGFMIGPIALLFATNLMVEAPDSEKQSVLDQFYFKISRLYFILLFFVQLWVVGLDLWFESVAFPTFMAGFIAAVFLGLALVRNYKVHVAGAVLTWAAFLLASGFLST